MSKDISLTKSGGKIFADDGFGSPEEHRLLAPQWREKKTRALDSYQWYSSSLTCDEAAQIFHGEVAHLNDILIFQLKHDTEETSSQTVAEPVEGEMITNFS